MVGAHASVTTTVYFLLLEPNNIYSDYNLVSRYQHVESKRAIMRLEQGSHSCIQRAIDSYGALAILYSRHSKHYIKKLEVFEHVNRLLGQLVIWGIIFIDSFQTLKA